MDSENHLFFQTRGLLWLIVLLGVVLGLGIRFYDLTDPPFDFQATRQLRSAIIARGMYYADLDDAPEWQRERALAVMEAEALIEPPILERLSVWGYHLTGGEHLWIPRLLSALFWVSAGVAVFLLGCELGTPDGGVVALFYLLFLPYSIYASRAFQPDPLMVASIAWAVWAAARWYRLRTMRSALLAGLLAGVSLYIKTVAVFFVGSALVGLVLFGLGLRKALRDRQVWALGVLALLPTVGFYIYGLWIDGYLRQQFQYRFFPDLLRDPAFYIRWQEMATNICGFGTLLAALVGLLLLKDKGKRGLLAGMWLGYFAYSMTFAYHTLTHDYYQLPLIFIIAASLTVLASEILGRIAAVERGLWARFAVMVILLVGAMFKTWDVRVNLARDDYRGDAAFWQELGEWIPPDSDVLSMSQAYGQALYFFGWVPNDPWLSQGDINMRVLAGTPEEEVVQAQYDMIPKYDYFVITKVGEFRADARLSELMYNNYTLVVENKSYTIFDLRK
ncbi:MAG: glycosyltransferase family 39 protein [Anaerolineae bacterium]|nr:glycosyltransferase family 39 protein [Anaerolineae bacterium]